MQSQKIRKNKKRKKNPVHFSRDSVSTFYLKNWPKSFRLKFLLHKMIKQVSALKVTELCCYRPPAKLRQGNVLSRVCLSFCSQRSGGGAGQCPKSSKANLLDLTEIICCNFEDWSVWISQVRTIKGGRHMREYMYFSKSLIPTEAKWEATSRYDKNAYRKKTESFWKVTCQKVLICCKMLDPAIKAHSREFKSRTKWA